MRLAHFTPLLAIGGLLSFSVACDSDAAADTDAVTTAPGDDDDDADADADADTGEGDAGSGDTAIVWAVYAGEATVVPDVSYDGFENLEYVVDKGPSVGLHLCDWQWQIENVTLEPALDCSDGATDCEFAFTLSGTGGAVANGTGCELLFETMPSTDIGTNFSYGYHKDFVYNGTPYGPYLLYYVAADPTNGDPAEWAPVSSYTSFDSTTGDFDYDWYSQGYIIEDATTFLAQFP